MKIQSGFLEQFFHRLSSNANVTDRRDMTSSLVVLDWNTAPAGAGAARQLGAAGDVSVQLKGAPKGAYSVPAMAKPLWLALLRLSVRKRGRNERRRAGEKRALSVHGARMLFHLCEETNGTTVNVQLSLSKPEGMSYLGRKNNDQWLNTHQNDATS